MIFRAVTTVDTILTLTSGFGENSQIYIYQWDGQVRLAPA